MRNREVKGPDMKLNCKPEQPFSPRRRLYERTDVIGIGKEQEFAIRFDSLNSMLSPDPTAALWAFNCPSLHVSSEMWIMDNDILSTEDV